MMFAMYQPNNLYQKYKERVLDNEFSAALPDVTKKATLDHINFAINLCERWDTVLDVGCSNGHYIAALAAKFRQAVGVDIDLHPGQTILQRKYDNITFFNGPIESYPKTKKFNFVLLMDIFEHIPDIRVFMRQIAGLQEKGDVVYIVTPNPVFCGPAEESEIYHKKSGYHGHIRHYTKGEVVEICQSVGYNVEFSIYEETESRAKFFLFGRAVSRRDRAFSKHWPYRLIRPLIIPVLSMIFIPLEKMCYKKEKISENDMFATRSLVIALKKR